MIYLDDNQINLVKNILNQHIPNKQVVAFGSRVKGNFKTHSDLDLCIIDDKPLSFLELSQLREAFSNSDLPMKIDIVEWQNITEEFRKVIQANSEEISSHKVLKG